MSFALALAAGLSLAPPALPDEPATPRAELPPLVLGWDVPEGCPDREAFVELLRRFLPPLGAVTHEAVEPQLATAQIRIEEAEAGVWRVELGLQSVAGEEQRSFEAERCELAAEAAALVVSVALDPIVVVLRTGVPATPTAPVDEPVPAPPPEPTPDIGPIAAVDDEPEPSIVVTMPPEPSQPELSFRPRVGVGLRAGGGYGPLRAGAVVLAPHLALIAPTWRIALSGGWLPPLQLDLDQGLRGRFDGWFVGGRGCWAPTAGPVELPLCGGVEGGQIRGEGLDPIPTTTRATRPWLALTLEFELWWAPIERLALGAAIEGAVPLLVGGFSVEGQAVQSYAPVGVRGLAGLELRLP